MVEYDGEKAARNLKVMRAVSGLSSNQLSKILGTTHQLFQAVEYDTRSLMLEPLSRLSNYMGVDPVSVITADQPVGINGEVFTRSYFVSWRDLEPRLRSLAIAKALQTKLDNALSRSESMGSGRTEITDIHAIRLMAVLDTMDAPVRAMIAMDKKGGVE